MAPIRENLDEALPVPSSRAWIALPFDGPPGRYDYRTSVDLTGDSPGTANVSGQWAPAGSSILVNGNPTGNTAAGPNTLTSFTVSAGFVPGVKTLDFVVAQPASVPAPTGLRVDDLAGTAAPAYDPAYLRTSSGGSPFLFARFPLSP